MDYQNKSLIYFLIGSHCIHKEQAAMERGVFREQDIPFEIFFFFTHTHCILFLQEINSLTPSIEHG